MTVLVTGATGFIGSHLVEALRAEGQEVRALARSTSDTGRLDALGVDVLRGDLLDAATVKRAVAGCTQVYHLAGKMIHPPALRQVYFTTNVDGTRNVARACLEAGVTRMVYVSSAGVYGLIDRPPVNENSPVNPSSAYRESKWRAEQVVRAHHEKDGLPAAILRVPGVLGPRSFAMLGLMRAIASGNFRIIGDGENHDHLGYVSDIVSALRLSADTPGVEGNCYLVAGEEAISVNDLVRMIATELGATCSPTHLPSALYRAYNAASEATYRVLGRELPGVHRYSLFLADKILDISKAKRDLGYRPAVSTREGVHNMVTWYRENNYI